MSSFFGIPITNETWIILFSLVIILGPLNGVQAILGLYRKWNLGRILKSGILVIKVWSSGVYAPMEARLDRHGWLETMDKKEIFPVGDHTLIKGKHGEPTMAIVNARSELTQDPSLISYEMCLNQGFNQAGNSKMTYSDTLVHKLPLIKELKEGKRFTNINALRLWFDEYVYLPTCQRDPKWIEEEQNRIKQAEGLLVYKEVTTTEAPIESNAGTMTITKQSYPTDAMTGREFLRFMQEIHKRVLQYPVKVLPIDINGETITLQHLERFNDSLAPVLVHKNIYEEGVRVGRDENPLSALNAILPFVMIILAITVGGGVLYAIIRTVH